MGVGRTLVRPSNLDEVVPYVRHINEPRAAGYYVDSSSWPMAWSPFKGTMWYQTTAPMEGMTNKLRVGAVGECTIGYLDTRYIGRMTLAGPGSAFAYELEDEVPYTHLEVASAGILKFLNGPDQFEHEMTMLEVGMAVAADQESHRQIVSHLLHGDWQ